MSDEPPLQQMGMGIYRVRVHRSEHEHLCRHFARQRALALSGHILRLAGLTGCSVCRNLDKGATQIA